MRHNQTAVQLLGLFGILGLVGGSSGLAVWWLGFSAPESAVSRATTASTPRVSRSAPAERELVRLPEEPTSAHREPSPEPEIRHAEIAESPGDSATRTAAPTDDFDASPAPSGIVGLSTQGGAPDHTFRFATAIRRNAARALTDLAALADEVDDDPGQAVQVADLLPMFAGKIDEDSAADLRRLYDSTSIDVRRESARLLRRTGDDGLVRRFVGDQRPALQARDPERRADAAWELGKLGGELAVKEISGLLRDADEEVVLSALRSLLGCETGGSAADAVRALTGDERESVRSLATAAIARWDAETRASTPMTPSGGS